MSDIRVSVRWETPTVFAGENIECTITFRNVAIAPCHPQSATPIPEPRGLGLGRERYRSNLSVQHTNDQLHRSPASIAELPRPKNHGHRSTVSLNTHIGATPQLSSDVQKKTEEKVNSANTRHRRSVSIISIGADTSKRDEPYGNGHAPIPHRPTRRHGRASSLQVVPSTAGAAKTGPLSAPLTQRATTVPSPLLRASTAFASSGASTYAASMRNPQVISTSNDREAASSKGPRKNLASVSSNSKFPNVPSSNPEVPKTLSSVSELVPRSWTRSLSPVVALGDLNGKDSARSIARALSPASKNGTPRSSTEIYSLSNDSTETLASEYLPSSARRPSYRATHGQRQSHSTALHHSKPPETLMIGYVQVMGSFTVDGSLINQNSFEDVKRRGVIGGQGGGGVVGLEPSKRDGSLLGALGWASIGESLGGLLGGGELSSIKEMKGTANAKSVPIISTPQTILFVDLHLRPGESRNYTYNHPLPRGIPPSHKGRAIKIVYNLVIGTQRAQSTSQQHLVRHANVPFRVLSGVNGQGDILGHDLMCPYILLQNNARSTVLDHSAQALHHTHRRGDAVSKSDFSVEDFHRYVGKLLDKPRQNSSLGLLSPTEAPKRDHPHEFGEHVSMKDAIDLAIFTSNSTTLSKRSANRFEIKRDGDRVAVILLPRPAYRLGENISAVIDFQGAEIPCYSLHVSLEASEIIDPAIALRSSASIQRVTRRIHASWSENTVSAQRAVFTSTIPVNATPEFTTSGVSLRWQLRFEFITSPNDDRDPVDARSGSLLEEIASDERGKVLVAVQGLQCDSFDVNVPIRVYGASGGFDEHNEFEDYPI